MAGVYLLAFVAGLLLQVNGLPVMENTGKTSGEQERRSQMREYREEAGGHALQSSPTSKGQHRKTSPNYG